ncbi:MAG: TolC family protein, partial [Gemmatimonadetes bacterium]|nr:TolC family protein [Gemmatimonadota bacterium]
VALRVLAARLVLLRAEAALSSAAADTVNATSQLENAERSLARLLTLDPDALRGRALAPVLSDVVPPADRTAPLTVALARNAEVQRVRAQVAAAERTRAEARAAFLPRLQLAGRYTEYGSSLGAEAGEWQGGVQLGYPLFTGGARLAAVARAQAEVAAARADLAALELRTADAVDAALGAWQAAHAQVAALTAVLAQAQEVARVEQLALRQGAGVQSDYLQAEAEVFRARAALAQARYTEVGAHVELARVTGELSVPWLHENVESGQ